MKNLIKLSVLSGLCAQAFAIGLCHVDKINNLQNAMTQAANLSGLTVKMPTEIPCPKASYYAYLDPTAIVKNKQFLISIDSTQGCHGVKYCQVGSLMAYSGAKVEQEYDMNHKLLTQPVQLKNGSTAYYSAGHAMGDYFPPSIQWQNHAVLYTLTWDTADSTEANFVKMLNSIK